MINRIFKKNRSYLVLSYFLYTDKLYRLEHTPDGNSKIHFDEQRYLLIEGQIRPAYFLFNDSKILLSDSNKKVTHVIEEEKLIAVLPGYAVAVSQDFVFVIVKAHTTYLELLDTNFRTVKKHPVKIGANRFSDDRYFICTEYLNNSVLHIMELPHLTSTLVPMDSDYWTDSEGKINVGEVCRTLGIWNDQLILHLAKFVIVALDVKTGKRLWQIDNFFASIDSEKYIAFDGRAFGRTPMEWHLDAVNGKAYLLARHFFVSIDLQSQTCSLGKSYLSDEAEYRWSFMCTRLVDGEKIFFAGSKGYNTTSNYIGCFSIKEQEVLWEHKAEEGSYYEEAPRVNKKNLYVLDSEKKLHVFDVA